MSVEINPETMNDMRDNVHFWIDCRPTMHHTKETLTGILRGEILELIAAKMQKNPQDEITAEVGDVLFSTLALDSGKGEFDSQYATIVKYCNVAGTNVEQVFRQTLYKNEINYPVYMFHQPSPFINASDAIKCLRIFRQNDKDLHTLLTRWSDSEQILNGLPFFDAYDVTGLYRDFIKHSLLKIKNQNKSNYILKEKINEVIKSGQWDMVPLDLKNITPQNSLMLF